MLGILYDADGEGGDVKGRSETINCQYPYDPCMVYLPTFGLLILTSPSGEG